MVVLFPSLINVLTFLNVSRNKKIHFNLFLKNVTSNHSEEF